jgi:carboxyl-terminal processing protease
MRDMQFDDILNQKSAHQPQENGPLYFFKKHFTFYIAIFIIGISFTGGYFFALLQKEKSVDIIKTSISSREKDIAHPDVAVPQEVGKDVDFDLFWDVWKRVKTGYITKNTEDKKLFYGALSGMVTALGDPYSVFLEPDTAKKFDESLSGTFEGIGAEIGMKKNQLLIMSILPDTPAQRAGLRSGDAILNIDKKDTAGITIDYAVSIIRGKGGTPVVLKIYRAEEATPRDITIIRDKIVVHSVTWKVLEDSRIGYVKLAHFNQDTEGGFKNAVKDLMAKRVSGIILDMRNNPGGFLDTAIQVSGYWVDGQTVVVEQFDEGHKDEYRARTRASLRDMPTVVLVNEGSASAAEIVAGALQDYKKATLIGMKTFGKGSVQDLQRLKDGSAIKLTIAKWLTPHGRSINEEGIAPDIEVQMTEKDYAENKDPQLEKAIEEVKNIAVKKE